MSAKHRMEAWRELWQRYKDVFKYHWERRKDNPLPDLKEDEAEFLPSALSLQTMPVSPIGRWTAKIITFLILFLLLWAFFGHWDVVVVAQGKIIPSGYTKTLASVETARVKALYAQEGKFVKAGDVLIELDARISDSDHDKALAEYQIATLQAGRARALLLALETGKPPLLKIDENEFSPISADKIKDEEMFLQAQWLDYRAKMNKLDEAIKNLTQSLALSTQRSKDYKVLAITQDVSQHAWQEKEINRIELQSQLSDNRNQKATATAELRKITRESLFEANRIIQTSEQEIRKASAHGDLYTLTSPVDGTVQQLTVHTVGGVVPSAQPLMQIVPQQKQIEMEAMVENKDIGFIKEGQSATVKIDAFEYTKYGTTPAVVVHVSRDAIQDEKRGLIYSVKVRLKKLNIAVKDKNVSLFPGLSGSVEIKTGKRRIIEYVLSPLVRHVDESMRER